MNTFLFILAMIGAIWLLSRLIHRLICYQEYQCFNPMMVGEFRCGWREAGWTYAQIVVQVPTRWGWRTVYSRVQGLRLERMQDALPDDLRRMYADEACAWVKYRDAWAKENEVLPAKALKRS